MVHEAIGTDCDQLPVEDSNMVIESLLVHPTRLITRGLTKHNVDLPVLRTKQNLRNHLKSQLEIGICTINQIVAALVETEGWGRQQIYLYKWKGGNSLRASGKIRHGFKIAYVTSTCSIISTTHDQ